LAQTVEKYRDDLFHRVEANENLENFTNIKNTFVFLAEQRQNDLNVTREIKNVKF